MELQSTISEVYTDMITIDMTRNITTDRQFFIYEEKRITESITQNFRVNVNTHNSD